MLKRIEDSDLNFLSFLVLNIKINAIIPFKDGRSPCCQQRNLSYFFQKKLYILQIYHNMVRLHKENKNMKLKMILIRAFSLSLKSIFLKKVIKIFLLKNLQDSVWQLVKRKEAESKKRRKKSTSLYILGFIVIKFSVYKMM